MKNWFVLLACGLSVSSFSLLAQPSTYKGFDYKAYNTPVNYNYGELYVGQQNFDDDTDIDDATVISPTIQLMINENWIFNISYAHAKVDEHDYDLTSKTTAVGVGYRYGLAPSTDLVFGVGLAHVKEDLDVTFFNGIRGHADDSDTGYGASIGLMQSITEQLEGGVSFGVDHVFSETSESLGGELTYYPSTHIGIGLAASYINGDDDNDSFTYGAYARFHF